MNENKIVEARIQILNTVRDFVNKEVNPISSKYDNNDTYPSSLIDQMAEMGLFGITIQEKYGGMGLDYSTYAMVFEELSKGWMSITGPIGTHSILSYAIQKYGTEEQIKKDNYYVINGNKLFITNGKHGNVFFLLAKTDTSIEPKHRGITGFIAEKGEGFSSGKDLNKLGYRGVDTTELIFKDYKIPEENIIGNIEGKGFYHVMDALETGRINIAARAVGVATGAFETAIKYSQQRETFGKKISERQTIQNYLADMATKIHAARLMTYDAAKKKDSGGRFDMESGMAKLYASEICAQVTMDAMRIFGGYGYIKDLPLERYYRDAPLMIIGEGTSEIQRLVIAKNLLKKYREK